MACGTNMSVCLPPLITFVNELSDILEPRYERNAKAGQICTLKYPTNMVAVRTS
jgi:hypothetical protein